MCLSSSILSTASPPLFPVSVSLPTTLSRLAIRSRSLSPRPLYPDGPRGKPKEKVRTDVSAHSSILIDAIPSLAVDLPINIPPNVDKNFLLSCLNMSYRITSYQPPGGSPLSPTAGASNPTKDDGRRLTDSYPLAFADFHGSGSPCIYKTGPAWPLDTDYAGYTCKIVRAARPIHGHPIQRVWRETVWAIVGVLDARGVEWSTVDPLAYANAGEKALVCEFVVVVGVRPGSLVYEDAVAAAHAVEAVLVVSTVSAMNDRNV